MIYHVRTASPTSFLVTRDMLGCTSLLIFTRQGNPLNGMSSEVADHADFREETLCDLDNHLHVWDEMLCGIMTRVRCAMHSDSPDGYLTNPFRSKKIKQIVLTPLGAYDNMEWNRRKILEKVSGASQPEDKVTYFIVPLDRSDMDVYEIVMRFSIKDDKDLLGVEAQAVAEVKAERGKVMVELRQLLHEIVREQDQKRAEKDQERLALACFLHACNPSLADVLAPVLDEAADSLVY